MSNYTGQYLETAFVARDIMQIVDALDEDDMLWYRGVSALSRPVRAYYWLTIWLGFSYGAVLRAMAAAMFPEKMAKWCLMEC